MVVIRLQRRGTKKTPHHRIVVMERGQAQGSRVLDTLGHYDPSTNPPGFALDEARFVYWISSGAQVTDALRHLVRQFAKISVAQARA